jgi:hypothetical protein
VSKYITPVEYAVAGYTLADESCNSFFDLLAQATNNVQMTKADWTALGAATATILALTHSTSKPVGIAAGLFGLGAAGFDNYQKYALLTPYPDQTKKLVIQAMQAFRSQSPPEQATDILNADARVSAYARLCTYSSISSLAQQAISTASPQAVNVGTKTIFTTAGDQQLVQTIDSALGLQSQSVSDQDLALLAIMTTSGTDPKLLPQIAAKLSAPVAAAVWDSTSKALKQSVVPQIQGPLAQLASSNSDFKKLIDSINSATAAASPPAGGNRHPADIEHAPKLVIPRAVSAPWQPPQIVINPQ